MSTMVLIGGGAVVIGLLLFSGADIDDQSGPRLTDLKKATSTYGSPIIKVFGTSRVPATFIWSLPIKETKHVEEVEVGKGGEYDVITYTYSASFAAGVCEGPVAGIRKVWCDSVLVYDVTLGGALETLAASGAIGVAMQVFNGTDTQVQSWVMQSVEGQDIPAFRNLCYVVFNDLNLEQFGNRVPNITVEVVAQGEKQPIGVSGEAEPAKQVCVRLTDGSGNCTNDTISAWRMTYWYKDGQDWFGRVGLAESGRSGLLSSYTINNYVEWSTNPSVYFEEPILFYTSQNNLGGSSLVPNMKIYADNASGFPPYKCTGLLFYTYSSSTSGWPLNSYYWSLNNLSDDKGIRYDPNTIEDRYIFNLQDRNKLIMSDDTFICRIAIWGGSPSLRLGMFRPYPDFNDKTYVQGIWVYAEVCYAYCYVPGAQSIVYIHSATTTEFTVNKDGTDYILTNPFGVIPGAANLLMDYDMHSTLFYLYMEGYGFAEYSPVFSMTNYWAYDAVEMGSFNSANAPLIMRGRVSQYIQDGINSVKNIYLEGLSNSGISVESFLNTVYPESGLLPTEYDNSVGSDIIIQGYAIPNNTSVRNMISTIKEAFQFDVIEQDFKLQVQKRNVDSAQHKSILESNLIDNDGTTVEITRRLETELPEKVTLKYLSSEIDYQTAAQHAMRIHGNSDNNTVIDLPLSYDDETAKRTAEIILNSSWLGAKSYKYSLPISSSDISVGDIVTIYEKSSNDYIIENIGATYFWPLNDDVDATSAVDIVESLALSRYLPNDSSVFGEPSIIPNNIETSIKFTGNGFGYAIRYLGDNALTELYYPYSINTYISGDDMVDGATVEVIASHGAYVHEPAATYQWSGQGWILWKQKRTYTTFIFRLVIKSVAGYQSSTGEGIDMHTLTTATYDINTTYNVTVTVNGLLASDIIIYVDGVPVETNVVLDNLLGEVYSGSYFTIGGVDRGGSDNRYNAHGNLQNFSMYKNKILTESDINNIINKTGGAISSSRVTKVTHDTTNVLNIESIAYLNKTYVSNATAQDTSLGFLDNKPTVDIPTKGLLIDTVLLDNSYINTPSILATSSKRYSGWRGCTLYTSIDQNNYIQDDGLLYDTLYGSVQHALADSQTNTWDTINTIEVIVNNLYQIDLESVTDIQVYNGANYAILGSEILQFKDAVFDTLTRTWTLSNLLRGRRGTEIDTGSHVDGEYFIFLRKDAIISNQLDISSTKYYKFVTFNTYLDDAKEESIVNTGLSSRPYIPGYVDADRISEITTITWIRKDRYIKGYLRQPPMSESIEQYKIDVFDLSNTLIGTYYSNNELYEYDRAIVGNTGQSLQYEISQYSDVYGYGLPSDKIIDNIETNIIDLMEDIGQIPDPLLWTVVLVDEGLDIFDTQNEYMVDPDGDNAMFVKFSHPYDNTGKLYGYEITSTSNINPNNNFDVQVDIYVQTRLPNIYIYDYVTRGTGIRVGNYTLKLFNYSGTSYKISIWFGGTRIYQSYSSYNIFAGYVPKLKVERIFDTIYFYTNIPTIITTEELILEYSTTYTYDIENQIQLFCKDDDIYNDVVEIYFKNFKGTI